MKISKTAFRILGLIFILAGIFLFFGLDSGVTGFVISDSFSVGYTSFLALGIFVIGIVLFGLSALAKSPEDELVNRYKVQEED